MKNSSMLAFSDRMQAEVFIKDLCKACDLVDRDLDGSIQVLHRENNDKLYYEITFQGLIVNEI